MEGSTLSEGKKGGRFALPGRSRSLGPTALAGCLCSSCPLNRCRCKPLSEGLLSWAGLASVSGIIPGTAPCPPACPADCHYLSARQEGPGVNPKF